MHRTDGIIWDVNKVTEERIGNIIKKTFVKSNKEDNTRNTTINKKRKLILMCKMQGN